MFNRGETYKHISCLDMAVYVVNNISPDKSEPFILKVIYWNTHYNSPSSCEVDTIIIKREDAHKWLRIERNESKNNT